ncbi:MULTISPECIES: CHAT domain-containing protein [unclassified Microcoleus]|uniref:CHAT domain-containing protein n=1 Tax=unclassified Microcoleus TaxID=2642155 RepID=UPI0025EC608B|nr:MULTISPECIES: CHAT domain-containing protein [unclassified Microcoleus]
MARKRVTFFSAIEIFFLKLARKINTNLKRNNTNLKRNNNTLVPPLVGAVDGACPPWLGRVKDCCTILEKWYKKKTIRLFIFLFLTVLFSFLATNVRANQIFNWELGKTEIIQQNRTIVSSTALPQREGSEWEKLARERYTAGEFEEAAKYWQQAAVAFEVKRDWLNQAIALSNLSLTYQQFGSWQEAEKAIEKSLNLLPPESRANSPAELRAIAQTLDIKGNGLSERGQVNIALKTWQQAASIYVKLKDELGWKRGLISQVKAMQELGLYEQACQTLMPAIEVDNQGKFAIPDRTCSQLTDRNSLNELQKLLQTPLNPNLKSIQLTGSRLLGDVLRQLGFLNNSQELLEKVDRAITQEKNTQEKALVLLSLGNTYEALGNRNRFLAESGDNTKNYYSTALDYYRRVIEVAGTSLIKIQARLDLFSLLVDPKIGNKINLREAEELRSAILSQLNQLPPSRQKIYAEVRLMQSLSNLKNEELKAANDRPNFRAEKLELLSNYCLPDSLTVSESLFQNTQALSWREMVNLGAKAVKLGKDLGDLRATAYALGNLGEIYEQKQQWLEAQQCTEQALLLSQNVQLNSPDLTYQWQWQLGRIRRDGKEKDIKGAIAAYTAAFNTLQSVRNDLVPIGRDGQFDFRDRVEPVYRELVDLLLRSEEPIQDNLQQARNVIEALQVAELDNFFRAACIQPREINIDKIDKESAVIYPIILKNSLEVIIKFPGLEQLKHYRTKINSSIVKTALIKVRETIINTNQNNIQELKTSLHNIYSWLLKPAKTDLEKNSVKNLVFVLDGELRDIPMAALYDGSRYLIESYSLVLAPGLKLIDARQLKLENIKILAAGISQPRSGFSALPNVEKELKEIQAQIPRSIVLLNSEFIDSSIRAKINSNESRIVHLATHGKFSSNSEDTFILNWDKRINITQLNQLLKNRDENQSKPIELLVLSACQTAAGDNRATLGLAGVAVRAGARSTLASLWNIPDDSTSVLMKQFYKELLTNKRTKAEALRQAQILLLKNPKYNNPKIWSPYILVGNWL